MARNPAKVRGIRGIRGSPRRDEGGAFPVIEAILVAVLVLTVILFFTSVQRPTTGAESRGQDLGQVATDTLGILQRHTFTPLADAANCPGVTPPVGSLDLEGWVTKVLAGECTTAYTVDTFLSDVLPAGSHYALRLGNGVDSTVLLPPAARDPGTPQGARAAQLPLFTHWQAFAGQAPGDVGSVGQPLTAARNPVLARFADPLDIQCIKAPYDQASAVGSIGPSGLPWTAFWQTQSPFVPVTGAHTTSGSAVVTMASTVGLAAGMRVQGAGIPNSPLTTVSAVNTGVQVTLSASATVTSSSVKLVFSSPAATLTGTLAGTPSVVTGLASTAALEVGMHVQGTGSATAATIASIDSATQVTLSANAGSGAKTMTFWADHLPPKALLGTWAGFTAADCSGTGLYATVTLPGVRSVPSVTTTANSFTATAGAAAFTSDDVGRLVVGTGIPAGDTIATVVSTTQVTLAAKATTGGTATVTLAPDPTYDLYALQLVVWFGA